MTELQLKLLEYIRSCASTEKVCSDLKISEKQLYYYLSLIKNIGVLFDIEYGNDGKRILKFTNATSITDNWPHLTINNNNAKVIKTIAISDLHLGDYKSCFSKLDKLFDYAVKKGIHNILIFGDILNGEYAENCKFLNNNEQIEYFIKNYPYDKSINTIGIIGNHEKDSFINKDHIDPTCPINLKRPDIHLINRIAACLDIKDRQSKKIVTTGIRMSHTPGLGSDDFPILIKGHHHRYSVYDCNNSNITIYVPAFFTSSIGNVSQARTFKYPEFLEIYFYINRTDMSIPKFDIYHLAFLLDDKAPTQLSDSSFAVRTKNKKN